MKHFFLSLLLFLLISGPVFAGSYSYTVKASDIHNGYVVVRINLINYGIPAVQINLISYSPVSSIPKNTSPDQAQHFSLLPGMEQKKPFVLVKVPAYNKASDGRLIQLTGFNLELTETAPAVSHNPSTAAKATATASPLSSGTWYKIALVDRGIYKIDYAFLQRLGVNPANINTSNIRIVGNGGSLISENNAVAHPLDLTDNALWINDGGDGVFNQGDFIAFYANGTMGWTKDSLRQRFLHVKNIYADSSYYFISFDAGAGPKIQDVSVNGLPTTIVSSFNDYAAHDSDLYNPGKFGKDWYGEKFGLSSKALPTRDFNFPLNGQTDSVGVRIAAASRANTDGNHLDITMNGAPIGSYLFTSVSLADDEIPVSLGASDLILPIGSTSANFHFTYNADPEAIGYLNYIELNWRHSLAFNGNNFSFRDWRSVGPAAVANYQISGANASTQVWDITNPLQPARMNGTLSGNTYSFKQNADYLHEFVALDGLSFLSPFIVGKVDNQNLHAADAPKLVIVSYPDFLDAANTLADYHRQHDGMRVLVATTTQVYNEFSSGGQDIAGIRDMMRYFYLAAGNDTSRMPAYLLLLGDASYDYKNRISPNSNYVPTYESAESVNPLSCFTVDDYFGFLDDNEDMSNFNIANTLDIGIGRLPVNSLDQANAAVNKIINYHSAKTLGPWRLSNTYIGDNEDDAGEHEHDAEYICGEVDSRSRFSNDTKIYLDDLPFVSTPGGDRCPEANKAINDQIFKGTFLINYTGHGSIVTLAHERILTSEDFTKWQNIDKLPFMVTATCDYARYDNPEYVSNGEQLVLKGDGGTIAMLTTTGPVYAGTNRDINGQFLISQYTQHNGIWPTFGDAIRAGKNLTFGFQKPGTYDLVNFYRFTLLGDPALQPAFPQHVVVTDSIRQTQSGAPTDSIRALGNYTITGHINTVNGTPITNFNGRAYITIFDKQRLIHAATKSPLAIYPFIEYYVRDNVIFKGLTTVTNGQFTCSFIAPKDMAYDFGKARISYYAENGVTDAAGMDSSVTAGGFQDGAASDVIAPIVKPFIGDTLFHDGGITGSNTLLYIQLSDESGINVSGNGVGHDLTAVLDNDDLHPYTLNDYYETEANTYKKGHVSFPVTGLADGVHSFKVKAWDVYNNSGTGTVNFVVTDGKILQINNLNNYPNPFSAVTHFFFEHNHPGELLNVQIIIYSMTGAKVRTIETTFTPGGSHSNEIIWDGTGDNGIILGSGVYPYRMILSNQNGVQGTAYQKLVIVR